LVETRFFCALCAAFALQAPAASAARRSAPGVVALASSSRQEPAPAADTPPERPAGTHFELPPGPASRAWSAVAANTSGAAPEAKWARLVERASWDDGAVWSEWATLVVAARTSATPRASLAAAALGQGRDEDAWDHFAAAEQPDVLRVLLPAFLPGVAPELLGRPWVDGELRLEDGAHLVPRLPPLDRPAAERPLGLGRLERREMFARGLRVGAARFDLRVAVEQEGVQIDFDAIANDGEPARVFVTLPEPLDFELTSSYLDWERLEDARAPIEVVLRPGSAPITLYGRFAPRYVRWPSARPTELDKRLRRHGFVLVCGERDAARARVCGFAAALERLVGVKSACEALPLGASGSFPLATRLDFSPSADRERKFRALVSSAETWALRR
jgi:hypothetical protein